MLQALQETGYVPNLQARAMRMRRSGLVGVVTGRITNPFYPELLDGLAQAISAENLRMALWASDEPASSTVAVQAIQGGAVDGLIFTTATPDDPALKQAVSQRLPIVLVNRSISGLQCDQVTSDNVGGGRLVAEYFATHGHTDVAVVGGNDLISTGRERRQGFVACLRRARDRNPGGAANRSATSRTTPPGASGSSCSAARRRPTAVFCVNDLVGFGVQDAAHRLGIGMPDDLWVAGYDDIPMAVVGPDRPHLGAPADRVDGRGRRGDPGQTDQGLRRRRTSTAGSAPSSPCGGRRGGAPARSRTRGTSGQLSRSSTMAMPCPRRRTWSRGRTPCRASAAS